MHTLSASVPARDFASSDYFRRIDKLGAPYPFLATFRCLSPILSPPALTPVVRSWAVPSSSFPTTLGTLTPASCEAVRQWWVFPPAVSGPCCWRRGHNPGGFPVFHRTPVGKRQPSIPGSVVFQQGRGLRVSVGETGRGIRCWQSVAEASGLPCIALAIHGCRVTPAESRDTVCRVRWRVHSFSSGRRNLWDGCWSLRSLAAVPGPVLCLDRNSLAARRFGRRFCVESGHPASLMVAGPNCVKFKGGLCGGLESDAFLPAAAAGQRRRRDPSEAMML